MEAVKEKHGGDSKGGKSVYNAGYCLSEIKAKPSDFLRENNPDWIAKNAK